MAAAKPKKWSQRVTETSDAMDVARDTFTGASAKKIAETVEHDAETSKRRKASPYRSAMSMLTFYINRAGKNLGPKQRKVLEDAKDVLRAEFGPQPKSAPKNVRAAKKTIAAKKTGAAKKATAAKKTRRKRAAG